MHWWIVKEKRILREKKKSILIFFWLERMGTILLFWHLSVNPLFYTWESARIITKPPNRRTLQDLPSPCGSLREIDRVRGNHSAWLHVTPQATLVAWSSLVTAEGVIDRRRYRTGAGPDWSETPLIDTSPQGGERGSAQSAERTDTVLYYNTHTSPIKQIKQNFCEERALWTTYPVFLQAPCTQGPLVSWFSPGLFYGTWSPPCLQAPAHHHCRTHTLMNQLNQAMTMNLFEVLLPKDWPNWKTYQLMPILKKKKKKAKYWPILSVNH